MFVIAGTSGRTGRVVAEGLLAQGKPVRVVLRDPGQASVWRARAAEVAIAALDDAAALTRALAGARGFYTLLPEDPTAPDVHALQRRVIDAQATAVQDSGVDHVVLLSAAIAALPAECRLAHGLHQAETALRATGCRLSVIRAAYFQDNVAAVLPPARHEGVFPSFLPADLALPMVATRDVGRLAARCLLEPPEAGEVIDLLGPLTTPRQVAAALGAALGKSLHLVELPPPAHVDMLIKVGLPRPFAEAVAEVYACLASGRVTPGGDRRVAATTTIDAILPGLVS